MNRFLASALLIFSASLALAKPGDVVNVQKLSEMSKASIEEFRNRYSLRLPNGTKDPVYAVQRYKVTYETTNIAGEATEATGIVFIPKLSTALPLLSYQHGTTLERSESPSALNDEMVMVTAAMASRGFVGVAADYLGLGDNEGPHPYHHAATEATAATDLLRATKNLQTQLKFKLNSQLFLTGYSQGGHATMALQIYLEKNLAKEFKITASAPMAGPYDLESIFLEVFSKPVPRSAAELAYLVHAMQAVYGDIGPWTAIFVKKYAGLFDDLFDGEKGWNQVQALLPADPKSLFKKEFIDDYKANAQNPLRKALRENSIAGVNLKAPTRLIHGDSDKEVPFSQSVELEKRLKKAGSKNIELVLVTGDHEWAVQESVLTAIGWFLELTEN